MLVLATGFGCTGVIDGGSTPGSETSVGSCELGINTAVRVRRLTRGEIDRSVSDLLGEELKPSSSLPLDTHADGYTNQADALIVTPLFAEGLSTAAEELAAVAVGKLGSLLPCSVSAATDDCAREFIVDFGRRAYRRDLESSEVEQLFNVYLKGKDGGDFKSGIGLLIQGIFQSPNFIYRTEIGAPQKGGIARLSQHEIATELSFLVQGGPPDAELMAAADAGLLDDADARVEQVLRLLDDDKARAQMSSFLFQWVGIDGIDQLQKDATMYPAFSPELAAKMRQETALFMQDVVFDGDATLRTLLTADYTFADAELSSLYGATAPTSAFARVALDPAQRSGLFTQASVLATFAQSTQSSPVRRGKFVRTRLLCQEMPKPPKNLMVVAPTPSPKNTTRQRFAAHSKEPCYQCHRLMDPIGFGFENYDGIGRYRETENGFPIDASGELIDTHDADGAFSGVVELAQRLSESQEVRSCFVENWLQFALARANTSSDACTLKSAFSQFTSGQRTIKDLVVDIVRHDEFVLRRAPKP